MREFVIVGHLAKTSPDFSLEDIPGTSGRIDVLCRCINSAFMLSHGIRRDVRCDLLLLGGPEPKVLRFDGSRLRHLNPDERSTAALIKRALTLDAGDSWRESTPGIYVKRGDLRELLESLKNDGLQLYYLREDGVAFDRSITEGAFILGDHIGMTEDEENILQAMGASTVSIGPLSLHADHCIVIINWLCDNAITTNTEGIGMKA